MKLSRIYKLLLYLLVAAALAGCALVDEDMRDCSTDYDLTYDLRLVTNMTTELQTQLSMATDVTVANAIKNYVKNIFTDYAHDVDLSFYDDETDAVLHHEAHIMDDNQSSYVLYIPVRKYMHLALANVDMDNLVSLKGSEMCHTSQLVQEVRDTVPSHKAGIFTARLPMDIQEGEDQEFNVRLYMANCATAIIVDTLGSGIRDLRVCMTGFATGFNVCDSTYVYSYTPVVKSDRLPADGSGTICYGTVAFPSKPDSRTKTVIDTDDPFISEGDGQPLWQIKVYATLPDNTVTETVLGVTKPLCAGQLKLIKARAYTNGSVKPGDPSVSVSVTLDWTPGTEHQVIL